MRAVIYARYSEGPRQTDQSIEGQVADCRDYARAHGMDVIEVYADSHISGTSTVGRDEFLRMIYDAEHKRFDAVIVWKIDRFGRSREDIAVNKRRLRRAGVELHYAREALPEGPEGILLESLLEGLAEYYSADLRQKVIRGQREGAKKGRLSAGSLPVGFYRDQSGIVQAEEEKAEVIREIYRRYAAGERQDTLAQYAYDHGIRGRRGGLISDAAMYRLLRNEHYLGSYTLHGIEVQVPQIVPPELFDAVQAAHRPKRANAAGRAKAPYLLSGKCYCDVCGKLIQGVSAHNRHGKVYRYYKCPSKCTQAIPEDVLDEFVLRHTMEDVLTDRMIERLTDRIMEIQLEEQAADPAAQIKKDLAEARKKKANIIEAIEAGAGVALVPRLNELTEQVDLLSIELEKAQIRKPLVPREIIHSWLLSFAGGDRDDPEVRRRLISTFVSEIEIGSDTVTIAYNTNEKGPHTVRVRSEEWKQRSRTRTPGSIEAVGGVVLVTFWRPYNSELF